MRPSLFKALFAGAALLAVQAGLTGCLESESKPQPENAAAEQARQVSAKLEKPYPLNDQGEILAEIPPPLLAAMKENLLKQAKLSGAATLDELYDPATGKLRDAEKLAEIQHSADQISRALSKGAAQ